MPPKSSAARLKWSPERPKHNTFHNHRLCARKPRPPNPPLSKNPKIISTPQNPAPKPKNATFPPFSSPTVREGLLASTASARANRVAPCLVRGAAHQRAADQRGHPKAERRTQAGLPRNTVGPHKFAAPKRCPGRHTPSQRVRETRGVGTSNPLTPRPTEDARDRPPITPSPARHARSRCRPKTLAASAGSVRPGPAAGRPCPRILVGHKPTR